MNNICVDLDGVLARYDGWKGIRHFGKPFPYAREFMKSLSKLGHVVIFTCRCKEPEEHDIAMAEGLSVDERKKLVEEWLNKNEIPFDEIYVGQGKPFAQVYIDDRAVVFSPSKNGYSTYGYSKALIETQFLMGVKI